jgi:hypothetical protein
MNQKIKRIIDEISRTKAKILELQALLPELERKRLDMENNEIIRLVRNSSITLADLPECLEYLQTAETPVFEEEIDEEQFSRDTENETPAQEEDETDV